jgi:hypothetical protein
MNGSSQFTWLLSVICFLALPAQPTKTQGDPGHPEVDIEGLDHEYASCAVVHFSVKNASQHPIYLEVYAEELKSDGWTYVDHPYDLRDPKSLYVKRVLANPDMMGPGTRVEVTYDRCLKPRFVKGTRDAFVGAIKKKDQEPHAPTQQRFRVDVYALEQGHVKIERQDRSQPFMRVPDKQSDPTRMQGKPSASH